MTSKLLQDLVVGIPERSGMIAEAALVGPWRTPAGYVRLALVWRETTSAMPLSTEQLQPFAVGTKAIL